MLFIIIEGNNGGYILYCRASKTLEVIATRRDKDGILNALEKFCAKFDTRKEMEKYTEEYESINTQQGIIYSTYNNAVEEMWNTLYKDIWEEKIEFIISRAFPKIGFRKKFRIIK